MELTREAIVGVRFAQAVDGFNRRDVLRHLDKIAVAVDALQRTQLAEREDDERDLGEAESLLDAARNEADAIRAKAAEQAECQLSQAILAVKGLLDRVHGLDRDVEQAQGVVLDASGEMVRRLVQSAPLVGALRERAQALGAELDLMVAGMTATPAAAKPEPASGPDPAQEPEPADDGATDADARAGTERARLVVLNMALGGSSREEAERRLREDFDIDGRDEILDEAFGSQDDGA